MTRTRAELVPLGAPGAPVGLRQDLARLAVGAGLDLGDQLLFPGLALELPGAEAEQDGERDEGRDGRAQTEGAPAVASGRPDHFWTASFLGLVVVLQRDHDALEGPHQGEAQDGRQREPMTRWSQIGGSKVNSTQSARATTTMPDDRHDEEGRAVARCRRRLVEAAGLAGRAQRQEALEQMALAAAGAAPFRPATTGEEGQ